MYKRVIALIGALVAIVAMTVIPVSAAETNYIEDYVYANNDNIIVWNYAPGVLIEDQIMLEDDGLMYITAVGQSAQYGDLATFTVTKEYSTCMIYVDYYSDFPADAGFRNFDIVISVDGQYHYVLDGMAAEDVLELRVQQGSTITIRIEWGMKSGQTYDDYSVYISCHPYVQDPPTSRPDYTVPWLWLQSLSVDDSSSDLYQEGYQSGFTDGYDEGFGVGSSDGYQQGFDAAMNEFSDVLQNSSVKNIFELCTLTLSFKYTVDGLSSSYSLYHVPFDFSNGTASFTSSYNYVINYMTELVGSFDASLLSDLEARFNWSTRTVTGTSFIFSEPIYTNLPSATYPGLIMAPEWPQDAAEDGGTMLWIKTDGTSNYFYSDLVSTKEVLFFTIRAYSGSFSLISFASLRLWTDLTAASPGYAYGYTQGFMAGQESISGTSIQDSYDSGYGVGYNVGFSAGKKEGLQISETGDWRSLMLSVVETPVNTFQSLFNFEILGLDMRAAFGSILAICVLLIIVKKVVL